MASDNGLLDADEEEFQMIGRIYLAAGSGTKTFGTSGSKVGWLPGASITFQATANCRVGVKKSSTVDAANGPPARATIGAAAFDVYDDLVGGTDTITSTTWREDAMSAGTPFSVTHGDLLAVCFHLDITSNTQSIKVRCGAGPGGFQNNLPTTTLVTSGPTYTAQTVAPNFVLTFDDGTLGWFDLCYPFSAATTEAIGNTNWYGNIFTPWAPITVDAILAQVAISGTTNFDFGVVSTPLGTPAFISGGSVSIDPQIIGRAATGYSTLVIPLPSELTLTAATDYAVAIKQNSATDLSIQHYSVDATAHLQAAGLDSTCYAAKSTAGGAFAAQNSGKRRAWMHVRVSGTDAGGAAGGLLVHPGMSGGMRG